MIKSVLSTTHGEHYMYFTTMATVCQCTYSDIPAIHVYTCNSQADNVLTQHTHSHVHFRELLL